MNITCSRSRQHLLGFSFIPAFPRHASTSSLPSQGTPVLHNDSQQKTHMQWHHPGKSTMYAFHATLGWTTWSPLVFLFFRLCLFLCSRTVQSIVPIVLIVPIVPIVPIPMTLVAFDFGLVLLLQGFVCAFSFLGERHDLIEHSIHRLGDRRLQLLSNLLHCSDFWGRSSVSSLRLWYVSSTAQPLPRVIGCVLPTDTALCLSDSSSRNWYSAILSWVGSRISLDNKPSQISNVFR